jgi:hypothetical protein
MYFMDSYADCSKCINDRSRVSCRSASNPGLAFCCDPKADPECDYTGDPNFSLCSNFFAAQPALQSLSCPYDSEICGTSVGPTYLPFHKFVPYADMYEEVNNGVLFETVGSAVTAFRSEQCSYWWMGDNDLNKAFEATRSLEYESSLIWQIDVNVTALRGVVVQILNGTSFFTASDAIEINENDFNNGNNRFTYNVTFNVSSVDYDDFGITDAVRDAAADNMKGSDYVTVTNNIFASFAAVPGIARQPTFSAQVGLRYFNLTYEGMA